MKKIFFHIDANSAYLSWESAFRLQQGEVLDLRTIPSVIGGDPKKRKGIILAKSIPAKKFNIKTGESLKDAFKKCPTLIAVPPNYVLYKKCSQSMINIFKDYTDNIEQYSIDECFLDITDTRHLYPDPIDLAYLIKNRIRDELGFTVSIGISDNKLLAKMASDMKKPDAVTTLFPHEIQQKMWPLPINELFMIGKKTEIKLKQLGIHTIGELANFDLLLLQYKLKSHGSLIYNYAWGKDLSHIKKTQPLPKSIGQSTTIPYDITNEKEAFLVLLGLCENACQRLRKQQLMAQTVCIHIKTEQFNYYIKQEKMPSTTDNTDNIFKRVKKLFKALWNQDPIRHLGIRLSDLTFNDFYQYSYMNTIYSEKLHHLDTTIDEIRERYDKGIIVRGTFANQPYKPFCGGVIDDDYPMMNSHL